MPDPGVPYRAAPSCVCVCPVCDHLVPAPLGLCPTCGTQGRRRQGGISIQLHTDTDPIHPSSSRLPPHCREMQSGKTPSAKCPACSPSPLGEMQGELPALSGQRGAPLRPCRAPVWSIGGFQRKFPPFLPASSVWEMYELCQKCHIWVKDDIWLFGYFHRDVHREV